MKYGACERGFIYADVALFTRAWIEIPKLALKNVSLTVALFTRAWIEITLRFALNFADTSPSLRGRGLKYSESRENP